jgi:antitoxin HicB
MAVTEPGDDPSIVIVTFPDVPEAITEGHGLTEALINAEDALAVALLSYPLRGKPVPEAVLDHGTRVTVAPDVAAKLALLEAFQSSGMTKSDFARRLGKDEKEVRRLLDPMHASKLPALVVALGALGKRLVIGVEDRAA